MIHAAVHIESWAVDLHWDCVARWGGDPDYDLPLAFFTDIVAGAVEETEHFLALRARLRAMGAEHGDFPAHDGLWESATDTASSLPARLAVEHCVHEARGLDALPRTIARLRNGGDEESAILLETVVMPEEVGHCATGVRWIARLHAQALALPADGPAPIPAWAAGARDHADPGSWFRALVRLHFRGDLLPPFNLELRAAAGFPEEWWLPLAREQQPPPPGPLRGRHAPPRTSSSPAPTRACPSLPRQQPTPASGCPGSVRERPQPRPPRSSSSSPRHATTLSRPSASLAFAPLPGGAALTSCQFLRTLQTPGMWPL